MKKILRKVIEYVLSFFSIKNDEKIIKKLNKYDYISFDMFDTLVKRNVARETDVFKLVEKKYNSMYGEDIDFYSERIKAEKEARNKSLYCEVTLDEIYEYLKFDKETNVILKNFENEMEIKICVPNLKFKKIYDYCIKKNKNVFITSDMYLTEKTINDILRKCGYSNYIKLFLSSTERKQKKNFSLFKQLINEYNIPKGNLVHIGDNVVSDFMIPRYKGIKTILIDKDVFYLRNMNKRILNKDMYYNYLSIVANNMKCEKNNILDELGTQILAPIICSFCLSLNEYVKKEKISKIFFLARDAKIIMDIYSNLYPDEVENLTYMYVSRKALLYPSMLNCKNLKDFQKKIDVILGREYTLLNIFKLFNIDKSKVEIFDLNKKMQKCSEKEKKQIFDFIMENKKNEFEEQGKYFRQYLKQINFIDKVCLVDIGWRGSIQNMITDFCKDNNIGVNINAYYLGILNETNSNAKGLLFDLNRLNTYEINKIILSISFFETLFLNTDGSTISYKKLKDEIVPIKKDKDNLDEIEKDINYIHNKAIDFSKKIDFNIAKTIYDYKNFNYMNNYEKLIVYPNMKTINFIKKINFDDNGNKKIINNRSILYYIFHLKKFKYDFMECKYKIGFMKNLLKIHLPYYKILNFTKKKAGEK